MLLSRDAHNSLMNLIALIFLIKQNAPMLCAKNLLIPKNGQHVLTAQRIQRKHNAGYQLMPHQNANGKLKDVLPLSAKIILPQPKVLLQQQHLLLLRLQLITGLLDAMILLFKICY